MNKPVVGKMSTEHDEARIRSALHMQRGMMDHVKNGTTSREAGPMKITPAVYVDPARFEAEQREIFLRLPLFVGLSRDIPNPGDKLLFEAAGPSIVVTRDLDGKINAFLNLCRHRGAKVVTECKTGKAMTCRFHAWTYDLQGKLVGLPGAQGFEGIDRAGMGLVRVPSAEWHGMIFVKATPGDEEIDVETYLGSLAPELAMLDLANAKPIRSSRQDVGSNWKYALDTYGEGYHFGSLHPTTIAHLSPTDVMFYDAHPPHHRLGFPRHDFKDYADRPQSEWPAIPHGGVHLLFPNTIIQVEKMSADLEFLYGFYRMFPNGAVDKAFTLMSTYRPGDVPEDEDPKPWEEVHDFVQQVVSTEDYSVSKDAQNNLRYAPDGLNLVFGSNEISLQRFHRRIAELIGYPTEA